MRVLLCGPPSRSPERPRRAEVGHGIRGRGRARPVARRRRFGLACAPVPGDLILHRRAFVAAGLAGVSTLVVGGAALAQAAANPLIAPWPGRFGGLPPFDAVRPEHFVPGFEAAMAAQRAEIAAIV